MRQGVTLYGIVDAGKVIAPAPTVASTANYEKFAENPWKRVAEQPVSTFSADVDTGSYANVRRFINRGQLPVRDAVRVEELVNYFGYDYAVPPESHPHPFAVDTRLVVSPWDTERTILRIALKGKDLAKAILPPANLVFLVDVSGSMGPTDRLPLVRSALKLLVAQLRPMDRVSLVSYANGTRIVLAPTAGDQKDSIINAIDSLSAGGGTHGEAGVRLAYAQARAAKIPGGINRVLLATDGDLNIGVTNPQELKALVEAERNNGVSLTTLGVGDNNFNEMLMKRLADAGDGSYHYLDSLQEAHKVLVNEMTSTLAVIAQDVKLQVEFNPANVDEYRLLGYELRALTQEEFNNDKVDAGDVGAGHTVTALYELVLKGAKGSVDTLRYQAKADSKTTQSTAAREVNRQGKKGELAWVKLRYKEPGQSVSNLVEFPVHKPSKVPAMASVDTDLKFALAVAGWGQWLRGSSLIEDFAPDKILALARDSRGADRFGHRAEFLRLVELSASLRR
jgi:Ca-activated chloride channel family protein